MPQQRDEEFAHRLRKRDKSVLYEIDAAYSGQLRRLLRRYRGPAFTDADVDDIVQEALQLTWQNFRLDRGSSVRAFYFGVANNKRLSLLRSSMRRLKHEVQNEEQLSLVPSDAESPDQRLIDVDNVQEEIILTLRLKILMDHAVAKLTPRQRRAYEHRYLIGGQHWAKELAKEPGITAQAWRKASDEAVNKIKSYLETHGVGFSREEGRFEVG